MKKFLTGFVLTTILMFSAGQAGYSFGMQDKAYKEELVKTSGHSEYTLKNMKSIMGEKELVKVLKKYDKHPEK